MSTLDLADGVYDADTPWRGMVMETAALIAGAFPVRPPSGWFTDPRLSQLSPLSMTSGGRVYGHIAAWHTSHIGMAGGVKPPRSKSNYAYFRTGTVECDDGSFVDVGQITLAGGHASLEASVREAVAHYDNTNSAVMDVAAGEDKHGIWVAGALRPDVTESQLRAVRASSVSGDWRPINGRLELVAVCSVNCPGFPIPRARVASGSPIALVAAGVTPIIEEVVRQHAAQDIELGIKEGLATFRDRILRLETAVLADSSGPSPAATEMADELRERVHGTQLATQEAALADLRSRVHGITTDELEPKSEARDAAISELRRRVRPETAVDNEVDTTWDDGLDIAVPIAAALRARVHAGADAVPFDGGLAASLRARVHGITAGVWNEALHPRGNDGKFIEVGGFVKGFFNVSTSRDWATQAEVEATGVSRSSSRAKVVGFKEVDGDTWVEVQLGGSVSHGFARASDVTQVAGPKAGLDGDNFDAWQTEQGMPATEFIDGEEVIVNAPGMRDSDINVEANAAEIATLTPEQRANFDAIMAAYPELSENIDIPQAIHRLKTMDPELVRQAYPDANI